jgi:hypothetical protein
MKNKTSKQKKTKTKQKLCHVFGVVGGGINIPYLKQNRQVSHIPKIDFRSKAKNIPKNTQNDNAISQ